MSISEEVKRDRKMADINADIGEAKREKFLDAIKQGMTVADARQAADIKTDQAYRYHRNHHPRWAAQVDFFRDAANRMTSAGFDLLTTPTTFADFVTKWFPDRDPHLPHQLMIADALNTLGPREICMFLLWPSAGKTSTLEDYICRKLAFDPSHRFRYVSEGTNLSKRVVGTVQRRFTETSEYGPFITRYGPFYEKGQERNGRPWTTEEITIARNPGTERDRNLVATSWTAASYGSRVDTLILDDIQSQRNMNQAEDIFDRIRGTFFSRDSRKSELRTLIVGTRIGAGDFYERMMDAGLITKPIILPVTDEFGEPNAPEFWDREVFHTGGACCAGFRSCPRDNSKLTPREFLELMRHQAGEKAWAASYLQRPNTDALSTFSAYLDACLDRERNYGPLVVA